MRHPGGPATVPRPQPPPVTLQPGALTAAAGDGEDRGCPRRGGPNLLCHPAPPHGRQRRETGLLEPLPGLSRKSGGLGVSMSPVLGWRIFSLVLRPLYSSVAATL